MTKKYANVEPFIAPYSDMQPTKEELAKRERRSKRLKQIGVDPTILVNGYTEERENPYRVEAMTYIVKDMEVPKELLKKIKEFDKQELVTNK